MVRPGSPRSRLLAAATALSSAVAVLAASCTPGGGHPGPTPDDPTCEDQTLVGRTVVVCAVAGVPDQELVIALHGRGSSGAEMRTFTQLERYAAEEGLAVAYPNGMDGGWGDDTFRTPTRPAGDEDVRFLDDLIDELQASPVIADDGPVGVVGFSNGGSMALRYSIERPDDVRAVVAVAGQLPRDPAIRPAAGSASASGRAVPLLGFYGTADPLRNYDTGIPEPPVRQPGQSTPTLSTPDTIAAFVGSAPLVEGPTESDTDPSDGTRLRTERWASASTSTSTSEGGVDVLWHTLIDGGHTWPSAHAPHPPSYGTVSHEIDASAEAIAFIADAQA
jgi:polyhydroxybutyrate depolymerase